MDEVTQSFDEEAQEYRAEEAPVRGVEIVEPSDEEKAELVEKLHAADLPVPFDWEVGHFTPQPTDIHKPIGDNLAEVVAHDIRMLKLSFDLMPAKLLKDYITVLEERLDDRLTWGFSGFALGVAATAAGAFAVLWWAESAPVPVPDVPVE